MERRSSPEPFPFWKGSSMLRQPLDEEAGCKRCALRKIACFLLKEFHFFQLLLQIHSAVTDILELPLSFCKNANTDRSLQQTNVHLPQAANKTRSTKKTKNILHFEFAQSALFRFLWIKITTLRTKIFLVFWNVVRLFFYFWVRLARKVLSRKRTFEQS